MENSELTRLPRVVNKVGNMSTTKEMRLLHFNESSQLIDTDRMAITHGSRLILQVNTAMLRSCHSVQILQHQLMRQDPSELILSELLLQK
jgi:hypothetical protein